MDYAWSVKELDLMRVLSPGAQSIAILQGKTPTGEPVGPLSLVPSLGYSAGEAGLAHLIYVVKREASRDRGILEGKPSYEARDFMASRVRMAAGKSPTLERFWLNMLRDMKVDASRVRHADTLWLRAFLESHGREWGKLRNKTTLENVIQAFSLLEDQRWGLWRAMKAVYNADPETSAEDLEAERVALEERLAARANIVNDPATAY